MRSQDHARSITAVTSGQLADLIARVEAARGPDRELDAEIAVAFSGDPGAWVVNPSPHSIFAPAPGWWRSSDDASHSAPAVTASLDAALALVERVLPGGWIDLNGPRKYLHIPTPVPNYWRAECGDAIGWGATPALALLLALLRALHSSAKPLAGDRSRDTATLPPQASEGTP